MLRPAHIGHLAMLRSLIRDGARDGSFQPELAWDSAESERFFAELKQALKSGYFVVQDRETHEMSTVAVPGYVYWADENIGANRRSASGSSARCVVAASSCGSPGSRARCVARATARRC